MKISIASDHAGFDQKQALVVHLRKQGHDVVDRGPQTDGRVDYPDFAALVARDVADGAAERGVLVCGTGIGMAMAANKVDGVRAANVVREDFAALCREHNDANVVTLSGRFVGLDENKAILDAFLSTDFAGGRHVQRVEKIHALEN
ncbi:ribose 5-phosphate isomerase B [Xiamenia xianingshaonis]|uniref:Ribose 5-phosphate isomerase B n=1 Tax=Xiamenia xianingshaonis TaxID=2682776 RepID=A0A9E6MRB5_9ACTN|nr:ribose 5-phosphate isomerase B [Xiamenia xianingshaonis]NGM17589.1 ribose 5-phosphate isomerase B [Eggerthellaceae bacterium zg-893]NHM13255.1 ribose 5-phosphate isomerase B [Xiamenia xianingshaonis]NHM15372.1 ribose 5-phosphate isomerase B [Xiamenia xianingshaonis]QTU84658.1 ribose 5-phosphate isomerase B [Xiamenia xianingshaonis]